MEVKFTKSHEWIRIEGNTATIGITDYAQKELGDIVFVELPEAGDNLIQGQQFATIESTKAAAEVYAPLSGEVLELNAALSDNPQLVNESPQSQGWMVKVRIRDVSQLQSLLDEDAYKDFIGKENK